MEREVASIALPLPSIPRVKLGTEGLEVSQLGLGCMGMSMAYGAPKPEEEMIKLIRHAVDIGVTFLDTADMYGPHTNELLVGKAIKGIREKVQIATKFGNVPGPNRTFIGVRGDPEYVRTTCEESLRRLDIDYIDLYYQHRVDTKVPIEITMLGKNKKKKKHNSPLWKLVFLLQVGEMKKLVEEGKVKYLGLSEASGSDIRRAHAVHPITAVQIEWSLWAREVEEDVIPTCRELGIGIVPYSPLGRGFFAGFKVAEAIDGDVRKMSPRFVAENLEKNEVLREQLGKIVAKKKCSMNQLALAWVLHKGKDVVPIPGTTKTANLESNVSALGVSLSEEEMKEIDAASPIGVVAGARYPAQHLHHTYPYAQTPPLSSWKGVEG